MLIIHGSLPSPFVRKARCFLEEKGIAYENRPLIPFPKTPELLGMNPLGKIPILEQDGFVMPDSSVICAYLERVHPSPALYPADPQEFARALWLEEYADTKLAETTGTVLFQRFIKPRFFQQETEEDVVQRCLGEQLPPLFDYLDAQVGEREYLVGGAFSIADVAVAAPCVNLRLGGETVDAGRWPELAGYLDRIWARPSFKTLLKEEGLA